MSQKQLTGSQVRQMFLDFFHSKGCMIEPGASLIPNNDPTLLWINSGVAALKKYFDGTQKPLSNRICNAQKSIRTNDIENVGRTARHHTFFEMLGNFSIGDYFKESAIPWAWEFLTDPKWIGFPKEKLYITVNPLDTQAIEIWKSLGIEDSHMRLTEDNFWEIGEGPGGPNTEIFYDRGEKYDPQGLGEKLFFEDLENDRYIEVWNVVFSQYDCKPDTLPRSEYKELPHKNIDTGMGLERLVCLIQDGETNFDTDLFLPIIHETEKYAKYPYSDPNHKMAYRVIADHIRTVTFAIADGAMFSNEGRGYVLRRVLRRAIRYGISLGIDGAFMYKLVAVVAQIMDDYYPYVKEKIDLISRLVKNDEESFHKTLSNGEELLNSALQDYHQTKKLPGEVVFKLYDTYGYPKELTLEIAQDAGYQVDLDGFEACMEEQKQRARQSRANMQSMHSQSKDLMDFDQESTFVGYTENTCHAKVIGLFKDGVQVTSLSDEGDVILDQTCFYAESGGQCADTGTLSSKTFKAIVSDVQKAPHKQHLHHITSVEGILNVGDEVDGAIQLDDRQKTRANHSSLHLLQAALKQVLGDHIAQAGSYNCPSYARFDFTHFEKVTSQQLAKIEQIVNQEIVKNTPVVTEVMNLEDAKKTGATALFNEKYGDQVRVVSMGEFSKEFCGGTHVSSTGQLGLFKIVSEESIGSGIRRITSITQMEAYHAFKQEEDILLQVASGLKAQSVQGVNDKLQAILDENASLKKQLAQVKEQAMMEQMNQVVQQAKQVGDLQVLTVKLHDFDGNLKQYAEQLRNRLKDGFVFVTNIQQEKLVFVCACSKKAIEKGLNAGAIVKQAAQLTGGNGGGKNDIAQAGGKDVAAMNQVDAYLASLL